MRRTDTKEKIFSAAETLFIDRGFEGASAGDVASAAKVNKALVFYHFESMENLYRQVIDAYYAEHRLALEDAFGGEGTPRERFKRAVGAYFDYIDDRRAYTRLVQREIATQGPGLERVQEGFGQLHAWMESTLKGLAPATGPLAAKHFLLTFAGMVINYFTYAPALTAIFGDALGGRAREERRIHLEWMVDTVLDGLERRRDARKRLR